MKKDIIEAVGVIIINKDKKVLLAKRNPDKPMPLKWEFPGGKLEANENLQECGVREIKEELNLDIKMNDYLGFEHLQYKGNKFCLHFFTASLLDEAQRVCLEVHSEALWLDYTSLKDYDFPAYTLSFMKPLKKLLLG